MVKFRLWLQILYWDHSGNDNLTTFPSDKIDVLNIPQLYPLLQNALYGFTLSDIVLDKDNVYLTVEPQLDVLADIGVSIPNNQEQSNIIRDHLIDNFSDAKYDSWMEGNMYYTTNDFDEELDFNLVQIKEFIPTCQLEKLG